MTSHVLALSLLFLFGDILTFTTAKCNGTVEWEAHKQKYNKVYNSSAEHDRRKQTFMKYCHFVQTQYELKAAGKPYLQVTIDTPMVDVETDEINKLVLPNNPINNPTASVSGRKRRAIEEVPVRRARQAATTTPTTTSTTRTSTTTTPTTTTTSTTRTSTTTSTTTPTTTTTRTSTTTSTTTPTTTTTRTSTTTTPTTTSTTTSTSTSTRTSTTTHTPFPPVDWRNTPGVVSPVDNQGNCAGCYAYSAKGALEGQLALKRNQPGQILSAQEIIDCGQPFGNQGCNGGWMGYGFVYVQADNLTNSANYPNTGAANSFPCQFASTNGVVPASKVVVSFTNKTIYPWNYVTPYPSGGNETLIMQILASTGPLAFAMYINPSFHTYQPGTIYNDPTCPTQNAPTHAMLLVGYGTQNGANYWIVKNSWGTAWGNNGYVNMAMGVNMCGFAYWVIYPIGF